MAAVTLDGVRKTYPGKVEAVKGVSLAIPDGAFTVLLGPSGCGKSTLLRMIAGLETITAGTIRIGDRVVNDVEPAARDIAMVFQSYALYPHMSVYDNMAYGLRNRGTAKDEIARRVGEAARLLEIEALLKRKPRELSGGQRQRVAMGRAIVREPAAFLFDEPLSNLDARLRVAMRLEIRRLHNRLGATSIFVTHDQVEAMTLADQVVVMNAGCIEQVGAPGEVYRAPATRFVASFIGSPAMNLLAGQIVRAGVVEIAGGQQLAFDAGRFVGTVGARVDVGVRPEDLALDSADTRTAHDTSAEIAVGRLRVERELIEELGATRVVLGRCAGAPFAVAVSGAAHLPPGERLLVHAPAAAVHLFDATTGRALTR